jgi:hypothetical protein
MPCAAAEYTLDPPEPLTFASYRLEHRPHRPDHKSFCLMPDPVIQAQNQTRYLKTEHDQEGAGRNLQCVRCGRHGHSLEQ